MAPQVDTHWVIPFGSPTFDRREIDAVAEAIAEGDLATGRQVQRFEQAFAREFGFRHAVAVTSGSTANLLALAALVELGRLRRGERVIVSGATFISAVSPVVQLGLVPVFVDLGPDGVNIDLDLVRQAVGEHGARGALLPHTMGEALDRDRLAALRRDLDLSIVEDCCESLGARDRGEQVGRVGHAATFSFYAGHHLTMGEGGVVACDDPGTAEMLRSIRAFGRDIGYDGERFGYPVGDRRIAPEERYIHLRHGYNAKLTDLQAAFGLVQLTRNADLAEQRRAAAEAIRDTLAGFPGWRALGNPPDKDSSPFAVVVVPPRDDTARIIRVLAEHGIEARGFLGASITDQPCFDADEYIVHEPYTRAPGQGAHTVLIGCPPNLDLPAAVAALTEALRAIG